MSTPPFQDWKLQLGRSYVQQVLAFPTTAACFDSFYWHATCWIEPLTIGDLPPHIYNRIRSRVRPDLRPWGGPLIQLYEFGGPRRYHEPNGISLPREIRLLLVFPYLEEDILEEARLRKWMEEVVIPAIGQSLPSHALQHFHHSSVRMIQLNSQAARVEGLQDVPDLQLDFYLQPEQLDCVWKKIRDKCETVGFEEFRGVCPVILARYSPLRFDGPSREEAFQKLVRNWNSCIAMSCIPQDGFYVEFITEGDIGVPEGVIS
ncbi:uncharacterized protein PV07_12531 [Cladophialophora immunda]|uniref:Uncharacterized protein n=1 Tax=Cladophialophora immunda TaxID=569365 RepID=A0A0D2BSR3_9EURO|nr:uncharacterized protein PV07_12531 [Cladophialophora immunda]KIW22068.1 hypothetical protein PV07_12531 [Cladophialophora immunda]